MSYNSRPKTFCWLNFSKSGHLSHSSHTWGLAESEGWPRTYLQPIHSYKKIHIIWMDTIISIAQEHSAERAPAVFMNLVVSHLQVSKPNLHAASTWSLLARVSPISLQASWASAKFSCWAALLFTRVTPIILHGPEVESSAKESQKPLICCCPCSQPLGSSS